MKIRGILVIVLLYVSISGFSQYLANPSLEGTLLMIGPPPDWAICLYNSSPNVQPGKYAVFLPPSDGITYIGLYCRIDGTWEDMYTVLDIPLSKDSCYKFKMDLAYWAQLSFAFVYPCVIKVYGTNVTCDKKQLLWSSNAIDNEEWETFEFLIHNTEFDITELIFEAYWTGVTPYRGYALLDNMKISPTPKMELGNDTTLVLCENDSIILDPGPGFSGYLWQDGSTAQTYVTDTSGLFWVQVFNAQGCSWTDSLEITIEEYQEMQTEMLDSTYVCEGQEVSVSVTVNYGAGPFTYEWLGLGITDSIATFIVDSTAFYVVEITDKCGNMISDSIKFVVSPGPEISLGADTTVCYGDDLVLDPGGGYSTYLWQDGSQDSVYSVMQEGWHWVIVSDWMGCVNMDSIYVDFLPELIFDLGNDTILCEVDEILLDAGSEWTSYLWFDGTMQQTNLVTQQGSYWVTITDENGCTASDTLIVDLSPAVVVSLGGDTTVCAGDNFILDPGNFTSYLWQDGSVEPYYPILYAGVYWVSVTDELGCIGADTINIDLNPSPQVSLGNDTVICTGTTITLDPGSQYSSYLWQDNSSLPIYTVNTTGYYTLTVTNLYDCSAIDEVFIEVTSPDIDLGADTSICSGDTFVLDPGQGYESYVWQDFSTEPYFDVLTSDLYSVIVTDQYNCSSTDEVLVDVIPVPYSDLEDTLALCEGDYVVIELPDGPFDYYWNGEPGGPTLEVNFGGVYTYKISNECGSVSNNVYVAEYPVPDVNLGNNQVLQVGETIELDAGQGFDSYLWQDGSGERFYIVTTSNADPDNPYYYVEVTDGPCKNSDTTKIVLLKVKIPNVFTPNGDSHNDTFTPMDDNWSGINKHHIEIFNRWGEKVWKSDNFEAGWDGKRNGRYVAEGTYFWILDIYYGENNITQRLKGTVTVLSDR